MSAVLRILSNSFPRICFVVRSDQPYQVTIDRKMQKHATCMAFFVVFWRNIIYPHILGINLSVSLLIFVYTCAHTRLSERNKLIPHAEYLCLIHNFFTSWCTLEIQYRAVGRSCQPIFLPLRSGLACSARGPSNPYQSLLFFSVFRANIFQARYQWSEYAATKETFF